eukprot:3966882-Amphidinium_carterae.1
MQGQLHQDPPDDVEGCNDMSFDIGGECCEARDSGQEESERPVKLSEALQRRDGSKRQRSLRASLMRWLLLMFARL